MSASLGPYLRSVFRTAVSEIGFRFPIDWPIAGPGKTKSVGLVRFVWMDLRIDKAGLESGTRCSCRIFIRSAGITHVALFRSISCHVACAASPYRQAVNIM